MEIVQLSEDIRYFFRDLFFCLAHACPSSRAAQAMRAGNNGMVETGEPLAGTERSETELSSALYCKLILSESAGSWPPV